MKFISNMACDRPALSAQTEHLTGPESEKALSGRILLIKRCVLNFIQAEAPFAMNMRQKVQNKV